MFGVSTPRVSVLREGWKNLSTLQVSKTFTLPAFKGLSWLSTATGEPVIGKFFSLSKSGASTSDGCIIATRSLTISPNCVKAIHRWEPGRVLGLSFLFGQRCSQLDLCVLNTYSPTNSRGATSEAREAHELSRAAHWQKCERVFRRIPRRCELVWAMDGNARLGTALPWVGAGGNRSKHTEVWNCNGGDLFDTLKGHQVMDLAITSPGQAGPTPATLNP